MNRGVSALGKHHSVRVACVLGQPVAHSLSPAIHNDCFEHVGVNVRYFSCDVSPKNLESMVRSLQSQNFLGASVTMPHKEAVLSLCDTVSPRARALLSVNTLIPQSDGSLHGDSTDGAGCVDALEHHGVDLKKKSVLVVGAGATARACIEAFSHTEVSRIGVMNRSQDRAQQATQLAGGKGYVAQLSDVPEADVIVHTTPVGMKHGVPGGESALPSDALRAHHVVLDAVYQPLDTQLLLDARSRGAQAIDGLWMLVYQAKAQQLLWTGANPDPLRMRFAAERELARRGR